jgi:hypothetical protein
MYTCSNPLCGLDFGRQKKLDISRVVCGGCKSKLTQTKPVPATSSGKENKPNPFGLFVKEHFANVKRENPATPHKEIMGILSKKYKEQKELKVVDSESVDEILIEGDEEVNVMATTLDGLEL